MNEHPRRSRATIGRLHRVHLVPTALSTFGAPVLRLSDPRVHGTH